MYFSSVFPVANVMLCMIFVFVPINVNAQCRVRKDLRNLSSSERQAMMSGFRAMAQDGTLERLRQTHQANLAAAHNNPYFLLWHRAFGIELENELMRRTTGLSGLPYHDLSVDAMNPGNSTAFNSENFGSINSGCIEPFMSNGRCVQRLPLSTDWGGCASSVLANHIRSNANYPAISQAIEGTCHNQVHSSFPNSAIFSTVTSPSDPWFYPFHAGIDFVFAQWQNMHSNPGNVDMNRIILNKSVSTLFTYSEGSDCYTYENLAAPSTNTRASTPAAPSTNTRASTPTNQVPQSNSQVPQSTNLSESSDVLAREESPWIPDFHRIPREWFDQMPGRFTPQQIEKLNSIFASSIQSLRRAQNEGMKIPTLDDFKTVAGNSDWTRGSISMKQGNSDSSNTAMPFASGRIIQGLITSLAIVLALMS